MKNFILFAALSALLSLAMADGTIRVCATSDDNDPNTCAESFPEEPPTNCDGGCVKAEPDGLVWKSVSSVEQDSGYAFHVYTDTDCSNGAKQLSSDTALKGNFQSFSYDCVA